MAGLAGGDRVRNGSFEVVRLAAESSTAAGYENHVVAKVNDHVVRIGVMTEEYFWHCHPDSDETFLVVEGGLFIDFDDRTVQVMPGEMLTVDCGVRHRTRPVGERSVNLTFEKEGTRTEPMEAPGAVEGGEVR